MRPQLTTRHLTVRALLTLAVAVTCATALLPAPASQAAASKKAYVETLGLVDGQAAGDLVPAGQHTLSFVLTNDAKSPQAFGSAQIGVPAGFTVDATPVVTGNAAASAVRVGGNPAGPVLMTSSGPTGSGVAPGSSVTVSMLVTVPAAGTCNPTWTTRVKQSNDFSGTGNDFTGNSVSTPVAGGWHLSWTTQPSATQYATAVAPAPAVTVLDPCGDAVTSFTGLITATDSSSDPATAGPFTATAVAGVATFSVSYPTWGYDHVLVATAALPGPTTCATGAACRSAAFHVYQLLKTCSTNGSTSCASGTLGGPLDQTRVSINSPGATTPAVLTVDVGGSPEIPACTATSGQPALGELVSFNTVRTKTVTMTLPKAYVNAIPNNGTPFMDICVQPWPAGFTDKFGNVSPSAGLLPDCSATRTTVCISARNKNAGNEIITFSLPAGDPKAAWY